MLLNSQKVSSFTILVFQKISPEGLSSSTQFAGDVINKLSDLFSSINIAQADLTNKPTVNTEMRFYPDTLRLMDNDLSHQFYFDTSGANVSEHKGMIIPQLTAGSDTLLVEAQTATMTNKIINTDQNSIKHSSTNLPGDLLKNNGSGFNRMARGTAGQLLRTNATASDLEWVDPPSGVWDRNAIETLTNKTISASSNTITDTAVGVGDLFVGDGTKFVKRAKGSAGQYLITNPGGTDIEWASVTGAWDPNASETLTNKTLSASSNSITDASIALGDLFASNGTKFVRKARGTANQILAVNSGGSDMGWVTAAKANVPSVTVFNDQANTFGDFDQTFRSSRLILRNSTNSFSYIFVGGATGANRNITLPALGADDVMDTVAATATLTNKTMVAASNTITDTSAAVGDLFKHNGTRFVRMARGTSLQVLRTNSGATDLEFASLDNERIGKSTAANGATTYNIAHGLGATPTYAWAQCSSHTTTFTYTVTSTNIVVVFTSTTGTPSTVTIYWRVVA